MEDRQIKSKEFIATTANSHSAPKKKYTVTKRRHTVGKTHIKKSQLKNLAIKYPNMIQKLDRKYKKCLKIRQKTFKNRRFRIKSLKSQYTNQKAQEYTKSIHLWQLRISLAPVPNNSLKI